MVVEEVRADVIAHLMSMSSTELAQLSSPQTTSGIGGQGDWPAVTLHAT
jgi:hypothetical protein